MVIVLRTTSHHPKTNLALRHAEPESQFFAIQQPTTRRIGWHKLSSREAGQNVIREEAFNRRRDVKNFDRPRQPVIPPF